MTVAAANPLTNLTSTPNQTDFPFTWRADSAADVKVYIDDVLQGGPTVNLNVDQVASPGGTVVLAPQAAGKVISIERNTNSAQTSAVATYGPFQGSLVERTMDRFVMVAQELLASFSRVFKVSRAAVSKLSSLDLPTPVNGKVLGYVDAGGGLSKVDLLPLAGGLNWRGVYAGGTQYTVGDAVSYLGSAYVLYLAAPAGTLPTDASKWALLSAAGAVGPAGADGVAAQTVTEVLAANYNTINDNLWRDVPGLSIAVNPAGAVKVLVSWNIAVPSVGAGAVYRLMLDGVEIPGTRQMGPGSTFLTCAGSYLKALAAGAHTFKMQYRTGVAANFDSTTDWQSSRISLLQIGA